MEQVLRIFRKDARSLWPTITTVLALLVAHAVLEVLTRPYDLRFQTFQNSLSLVKILLPLGIWLLIAQVIYQEAIPGENQFWLTRPYDWRKLLAAKVLFVVVFISVPLFLSDCCILTVQGLPVFGVFYELLLRQLLLVALFVVPSFAIATLTAGLTQFLLAWFLLLLGFVSEQLFLASISGGVGYVVTGSAWTLAAVLLVVAFCGIIVWQYAQRRTFAARLVSVAAVFLLFFFQEAQSLLARFLSHPPVQEEYANPFQIGVAYDPGSNIILGQLWETGQNLSPGLERLMIPLLVSGLTPDMELMGYARTTIQDGGGERGGSVRRFRNVYWQELILPKATLARLRKTRVTLRVTYNLDVFRDSVEASVPLTKRSFYLNDLGVCHSTLEGSHFQMNCRTGLAQRPEILIRLAPGANSDDWFADVPEYTMPLGLSPTTDVFAESPSGQAGANLEFVQRRKIGVFRNTVEIKDFQVRNRVMP